MTPENDDMQQTLFTGEQLRDLGMSRAEGHANRVFYNWSTIAFNFVITHLPDEPFKTEDIVRLSSGIVPEPPDRRAWGPIIRRAAMSGYIKSIGYTKATKPNVHANTVGLWIKTSKTL